jgi:hypothetical protein
LSTTLAKLKQLLISQRLERFIEKIMIGLTSELILIARKRKQSDSGDKAEVLLWPG